MGLQKPHRRSWRDTWGLRESLILQRTGVWFSEPAVLFMTINNSNPKGSNTIFWPLGTPGIHMVHAHIRSSKQNTNVHKINNYKQIQKSWRNWWSHNDAVKGKLLRQSRQSYSALTKDHCHKSMFQIKKGREGDSWCGISLIMLWLPLNKESALYL